MADDRAADRNRWSLQFCIGLCAFPLAFAIVPPAVNWLDRETTGRLTLERYAEAASVRNRDCYDSVSRVFNAHHADDLQVAIRAATERYAAEHGLPLSAVRFEEPSEVSAAEGDRKIFWKVERWGRYRLDPWSMGYVFDVYDPLALERNRALCLASTEAADDSFAFYRR